MSVPVQLVAKGCMVDLSLNARKQLPLLAISAPLHIVPSPPSTCPPSYASSRHVLRRHTRSPVEHSDTRSPLQHTRPYNKAASHTLVRKHSETSSVTTRSPDHVKGSVSQPISRETTREECEEDLNDVFTAEPNNLNISKEGRKTRRRKNSHRKSKSKHRLKSARGVKVIKESEGAMISPSPDQSSSIQAFTTPLKISTTPKRADKAKVEYVHTRARSQPEKVYRKSASVEQIILSASSEALGNIKSLKSSTESMRHVRPLKTPYGVYHAKQNKEQDVVKRLTKVYLSERQSKNMKELGMEVPMAPPATPLPDPGRVVEYVASLSDVRSQREVRGRLAVLERAAQEHAQQQRDARHRQERAALAELRREKRRIQRRQVGGGGEWVDGGGSKQWVVLEEGKEKEGTPGKENLVNRNPGNGNPGIGSMGYGNPGNGNPGHWNPGNWHPNGNHQHKNHINRNLGNWNSRNGNPGPIHQFPQRVVYVDGKGDEGTRNRNLRNGNPKNVKPGNEKSQNVNHENVKLAPRNSFPQTNIEYRGYLTGTKCETIKANRTKYMNEGCQNEIRLWNDCIKDQANGTKYNHETKNRTTKEINKSHTNDRAINRSDWIKNGFHEAKSENERNRYLTTKSANDVAKVMRVPVKSGKKFQKVRNKSAKLGTKSKCGGSEDEADEIRNRNNETKNRNDETKNRNDETKNRNDEIKNKNEETKYENDRTINETKETGRRNESKCSNICTGSKSRNNRMRNQAMIDRSSYKMFEEMQTKYRSDDSVDLKPNQQSPRKKIKYIDAPAEEIQKDRAMIWNRKKGKRATETKGCRSIIKTPMTGQNQKDRKVKRVVIQASSRDGGSSLREGQREVEYYSRDNDYIDPVMIIDSIDNLICTPPNESTNSQIFDSENKNSSNIMVQYPNANGIYYKSPYKVKGKSVKKQLAELIIQEKREKRERQCRTEVYSTQFLLRRLKEVIEEANKRFGDIQNHKPESSDIFTDQQCPYSKLEGLTGQQLHIEIEKEEQFGTEKKQMILSRDKSRSRRKHVKCKTPRKSPRIKRKNDGKRITHKSPRNYEKVTGKSPNNREKVRGKSPRICNKVPCRLSSGRITSKSLIDGYRITSPGTDDKIIRKTPVNCEKAVCKSPVVGEKICKSPVDGEKICESPIKGEKFCKSPDDVVIESESLITVDRVLCKRPITGERVMCSSPTKCEKDASPNSRENIPRKCPNSCENVAGESPDNRDNVTSKRPGNWENFTSKSPGNQENVTVKSPGNWENVTSKSPDNQLNVSYKSPNSPEKITPKAVINKTANKLPDKDDRILCKSGVSGEKLQSVTESNKKNSSPKPKGARGLGMKKREEMKETKGNIYQGPSPEILQCLPYKKPKGIEAQAVCNMQRKQIYALNAVMKELENKNFKEFCKKNDITAAS